eukprot:TRINITY_DN3570_c0_g1_i1.p1 TRINITY_DN3570_c0_g1~~TRINITY_DN3570_c0_g1_i1.p1  ORF type:complete len:574 (-),score=70.87 TRINITY_DN3570_c0_g1_i1:1636-3288(-)
MPAPWKKSSNSVWLISTNARLRRVFWKEAREAVRLHNNETPVHDLLVLFRRLFDVVRGLMRRARVVEFFRQTLQEGREQRRQRADSLYKNTLLQHMFAKRFRERDDTETEMHKYNEPGKYLTEINIHGRSSAVHSIWDSEPAQARAGSEEPDAQEKEACTSSDQEMCTQLSFEVPPGSSIHPVAAMAVQLKASFGRLHELASADLQLGYDLSAQMADAKSSALDAIGNVLKAIEVPAPVPNYAKALASKRVADSPKPELPLTPSCRGRRRSAVVLSEVASLLRSPVRTQSSNRRLISQILERIKSRDVTRSISELMRMGSESVDEEERPPESSYHLETASPSNLPAQVQKETCRFETRPPAEPHDALLCRPPKASVIQGMEPCTGTTNGSMCKTRKQPPNFTDSPASGQGADLPEQVDKSRHHWPDKRFSRETGAAQIMVPYAGTTRCSVLETLKESPNWTDLPASGHGARLKSFSDLTEQVEEISAGEGNVVSEQACHVFEQACAPQALPHSDPVEHTAQQPKDSSRWHGAQKTHLAQRPLCDSPTHYS